MSAAENNKKQDQLQAEATSLRQQLQQKEGEITQLRRELHLAVTTLMSHMQLFETSTLALEKYTDTYGRLGSHHQNFLYQSCNIESTKKIMFQVEHVLCM